jgi:hypothetical protein
MHKRRAEPEYPHSNVVAVEDPSIVVYCGADAVVTNLANFVVGRRKRTSSKSPPDGEHSSYNLSILDEENMASSERIVKRKTIPSTRSAHHDPMAALIMANNTFGLDSQDEKVDLTGQYSTQMGLHGNDEGSADAAMMGKSKVTS